MAINFTKTIETLRAELALIESAITVLETATSISPCSYRIKRISTRGRKSMGAEERHEVSARMKKYWAARRLA